MSLTPDRIYNGTMVLITAISWTYLVERNVRTPPLQEIFGLVHGLNHITTMKGAPSKYLASGQTVTLLQIDATRSFPLL